MNTSGRVFPPATFVCGTILLVCSANVPAQWVAQSSPTKERLRGLSVVNSRVAWASGNHGTVLRTTDAGTTWHLKVVPGASGLDFRDVHAVDDQVVSLLSIGEGEKSRIYRTTDSGESWTLQLTLHDAKGFLDAIAFWDPDHGLALGDPIGGRFLILATDDGGSHWTRLPDEGMPPSLSGEGAFAASGTCLIVQGERDAWFATGGAQVSRVFRSTDRGRTWTAHEVPIVAGNATSGVFSLAFRDANHGVAIGGDYQQTPRADRVVARTADGGRTWMSGEGRGPRGFRSGVTYLPTAPRPTLVAVGPTGSDVSVDDGRSWSPLSDSGAHAVGAAEPEAGWAVGENGSIGRFKLAIEAKLR